jgi:hypothetical protein
MAKMDRRDSITHTTVEPRDEGSFVGVFACGKEPEPVRNTDKQKQRNPRGGLWFINQMLLSAAKSPYPEA